MKLKQKPEDFVVEEILSENIKRNISQKEGKYKLYILKKKSLETFALLRYLSKNNNIPLKEIGFAGLKDKHASTTQHITIPPQYPLKTIKEKNFEIEFVGYVESPIKTGDLVGNKFMIVARGFSEREIEKVKQTLSRRKRNIENYGIPNYFDSQRFGSVIHREFIAKYLIRKDYENAVKIFLTKYTPSERAKSKNEKRKIEQEWDNILEGENIETKNNLFNQINSGNIKELYILSGGPEKGVNSEKKNEEDFTSKLVMERLLKELRKQKSSKKIEYKGIWNENFKGSDLLRLFSGLGENRFLKRIPTLATLVIYGEYIAYLYTIKSVPQVIEIQNKLIAEENKAYFSYLWEIASK